MQGIYRIRNKTNDKRYVGSTQNFDERWDFHRKELQKGIHGNPHLQNAWNKYGEKNFIFEIEEEIKGDRKVRINCEQRYLDEGFVLGNLYNIARTAGGGNLGLEVNQKISRGNKGKVRTQEFKDHLSKINIGHEVTEEARAKISKGNTGKKRSDEFKANLSRSRRGEKHPLYGKKGADHPRYGQHQTAEAKANMSKGKKKYYETHKGYWAGKHHTRETKVKIGIATSKSYPAFYNEKTGEFIPSGKNLLKLCREEDLNHMALFNLKQHVTKRSMDGWRLV